MIKAMIGVIRTFFVGGIGLLFELAVFTALIPGPVWAWNEATSSNVRSRGQELIFKSYKEYEVKRHSNLPFVEGKIPFKETKILGPTARRACRSTYLSDAHWGYKITAQVPPGNLAGLTMFDRLAKAAVLGRTAWPRPVPWPVSEPVPASEYERRTCIECHPQQISNLHTLRVGATCRHCHGDEPIAGVNHYYSPMNPNRRHSHVCAKCHEGASPSFAAYVIHETSPIARDTRRSFPLLFYAVWVMLAIAMGTFLFCLSHAFLWGLREFWEGGKRKKAEIKRIKRFPPAQRLFHLLMMLAFTTQAATGLARMYIGTDWGRFLASFFGGYTKTLIVHKWVGLFMLVLFSIHVIYVLAKIDWRRFPGSVYGPDSLLPRWSDVGQAIQHAGWFLGMAKPPQFDRWGYWEKFDYWAVFWGIFIIGVTGLLLYNPVVSSRYIPGWGLNIALWIHRIEAILAMGHVFIIHFFIGHLRSHNFPMDLAMFEGSVNLEKVRQERPAWLERLEQQGNLEGRLVQGAPLYLRVVYYVFGFAVITGCLYLLVNGLATGREIFG